MHPARKLFSMTAVPALEKLRLGRLLPSALTAKETMKASVAVSGDTRNVRFPAVAVKNVPVGVLCLIVYSMFSIGEPQSGASASTVASTKTALIAPPSFTFSMISTKARL